MSLFDAVKHLYPAARDGIDFTLRNDGGADFIESWNAAALGAQPSAATIAAALPVASLARLKAAKLRSINQVSGAAVSTITDAYPQFEIDTFDAQEKEARAWIANNASATPTLSIIAAGRGITLADLTARVIAKADAFRPFVASIIAKRQSLEDRLSAINLDGGTAATQIAAVNETEITTLAAQLLGG